MTAINDCRRLLIVVVSPLVAALSLAWPTARADCVFAVGAPVKSSAAYKERGKRCEGIYSRPVMGSARLVLQGYHLRAPEFEVPLPDTLTIQVAGIAEGKVAGMLVAKSVRPSHYYQMDTSELDQAGRFVWETGILKHPEVSMGPRQLAVLFCEQGCGGDEPRRYWPVQVHQTGKAPSRKAVPYLIVEPEVEIAQIFMTVKDATSGAIVDQQQLKRRNYPADDPIRIRLVTPAPGEYAISLNSVSRVGAAGQLDLLAVVPIEGFEGSDD